MRSDISVPDSKEAEEAEKELKELNDIKLKLILNRLPDEFSDEMKQAHNRITNNVLDKLTNEIRDLNNVIPLCATIAREPIEKITQEIIQSRTKITDLSKQQKDLTMMGGWVKSTKFDTEEKKQSYIAEFKSRLNDVKFNDFITRLEVFLQDKDFLFRWQLETLTTEEPTLNVFSEMELIRGKHKALKEKINLELGNIRKKDKELEIPSPLAALNSYTVCFRFGHFAGIQYD